MAVLAPDAIQILRAEGKLRNLEQFAYHHQLAGNGEEVIRHYRRCGEVCPGHPRFHAIYGTHMLNEGHLVEAAAAYDRAVAADGTELVDAGLYPETAYAYRVRAQNGAGASPYSGEAAVTTLPDLRPAAPSNLRAAPLSAPPSRLVHDAPPRPCPLRLPPPALPSPARYSRR